MELKPGYKQTEAGVIPEEWEVAKLATVCSMKSGEGITSVSIDQFSVYPCYGGNGLRGFTARYTHDGRYALIGRQGALCGNVLGVGGKIFASEHAIVVTASARTDIRWLTFVLGEMRLNQHSESSAQPGLSVSKLLNLNVARPPTKAEQEAIAAALSDADALIESLEQLIAKKRHLKQGAIQELLTGKKRMPGFGGLRRQNGEVGEIPINWRAVEIGKIASVKTGPFGSSLHERDYVDDGTPIITVEHLGERGVLHAGLPMVSEADKKR
jgi:type I restriction enzyme S subunit